MNKKIVNIIVGGIVYVLALAIILLYSKQRVIVERVVRKYYEISPFGVVLEIILFAFYILFVVIYNRGDKND